MATNSVLNPTERSPERKRWHTRRRIFEVFALQDQRIYYQNRQKLYQQAAAQVNGFRAFFALLTGLSAAMAGLIVTFYLAPSSLHNAGYCATMAQNESLKSLIKDLNVITPGFELPEAMPGATTENGLATTPVGCERANNWARLFMVLAIVAPALGGAFTTLADLYQWDRLTGIYEIAEENLEVADSQSPLEDMGQDVYVASVRAMVEGTLDVMSDETAQWGQSIRTPRQIEEFLEDVKRQNQQSTNSESE